MARMPDMKWFLLPPTATIEGYADVVAKPISMQDIGRKLFRGRFRKSKSLLGVSAPNTPRTPMHAAVGGGAALSCPFCDRQSFGSSKDLTSHLRADHYYADEFNENTKRKGRFHTDMLLIFKNCRTFNEGSAKFCAIADEVGWWPACCCRHRHYRHLRMHVSACPYVCVTCIVLLHVSSARSWKPRTARPTSDSWTRGSKKSTPACRLGKRPTSGCRT